MPRRRRLRETLLCGALAAWIAYGLSSPPAAAQVTWTLGSTANIGGFSTTVIGSPTVVATPFGAGLRFDGNDGVIVDANPLAGAAAFTMEMLLRPNANPSPTLDQPRILHVESLTPSGHRALLEGRIQGNLWHLDGFLRAPAASNPSTIASLTLIDPAKTHPVDQWYSYALVYDGTELRVYLNGALELSGAIAATSIAPGQTSIGMRHNRVNFFSGDIALVRFTRAALAPDALLSQRTPGDFNGDYYNAGGGVDGRDLAVWQDQFGGAGPFPATGANADVNNDGAVDGADFLIWQRSLRQGPALAVVPEPGAQILIHFAAVGFSMGRCRSRLGRPRACRF